jgi:capsular exopolysaccharide synthesis family protein
MPSRNNFPERYTSVVAAPQRPLGNPAPEWSAASTGPAWQEPEGIQWARYLEVFKRHLPLIVGIVFVGSLAGYFAAKRVKPVYEAQATVWINAPSTPQSTGPITGPQFLPAASLLVLLHSFAIVDPVVQRLRLNVSTRVPRDSVLFRDFESTEKLRPGSYVLHVDSLGADYRLSTIEGAIIERGRIGNTIGRNAGFKWLPESRLLSPRRTVVFGVRSVRATSTALLANIHGILPEGSQYLQGGQFLLITLQGSEASRTAATVNALAEEMVRTAGLLKAQHLLEFKKTLQEQLAVAATSLRTAENQLEQFRVQTITLPSGRAASAASPAPADPIVSSFFEQKVALDELQNERQTLERILADAKGGPINPGAFLQLPNILLNSPQLRSALDELSSRQAALRTEQQFLTDANPRVKQLTETVRSLERETIPTIALGVLNALRAREPELVGRIAEESKELRTIPTRATEETRLARQVVASENLYNSLKARYEEVSIAEEQSVPDLSVLDVASPPAYPSSNDVWRIRLLALVASVLLALGVAVLHDRLDRRVLYPEHATKDLGLLIAGTVPKFKPKQRKSLQFQTMTQAVESFRALRLAMRYDFPADLPVVLAVSSPAAGDGKSLIASNLALAFASSGTRTLLIDGDVRRGALHTTFEVPVTPGLVEYLASTAGLDAIVKATAAENLFVIPRGARHKRAPELLVSDLMMALVLAMQRQFDVVIIDSPPLVAGIDAYALGAAAGNMLIVLRPGTTNRKLAAAKLEVLDRLPVRILGTVLNGVPSGGSYRYYGSDYNYGAFEAEPMTDIATPGGLVLGA